MSDEWESHDVDGGGFENAEDGFYLDSEGVDSAGLDSAVVVDRPGKYHFEIVAVRSQLDRYRDNDMTKPQYPHLLVICEVLESVPGQSPAGTIYFHELAFAGKGGGPFTEQEVRTKKEPVFAFLKGIGLYADEGGKLINTITKSTRVAPGELVKQLQGRQFIGHIKDESWKNDKGETIPTFRLKYGKGAFAVGDERVADVPKCKAKLDEIGMGHVSTGDLQKHLPLNQGQQSASGGNGSGSGGGGGAHSNAAGGLGADGGGLKDLDI